MAVPTDPRDRLPPFLRRYCPTQEQCRQWSAKFHQAVQHWLAWLWHDAGPRWRQLERPWKIWSICVVFAVVFLPLLFIRGSGRTELAVDPSPVIADDTRKTKASDVPPHSLPVSPSHPQVATDNGWVRIVNHSKGVSLMAISIKPGALVAQWGLDEDVPYSTSVDPSDEHHHWRIEPVGDYYKIQDHNAGHYLAVAQRDGEDVICIMPDSGRASILWQIEPLGDALWKIVNRENGKCLVGGHCAKFVRQSTFRDGDDTQKWALERVVN